MKLPPFLKPGDTIGISATARKITEPELQEFVKMIQDWGMKHVFAPGLFEQNNQLAGDDDNRANGLQTLLNTTEVKAIVNARGGYGSVRVVDKINWSVFKENPKWICGFSDITVLHAHIQANCNTCSIHSPMAFNVNDINSNSDQFIALKNLLCGQMREYRFPIHPCNRANQMQGQIIGGNLSVIYSLLGSSSLPDPSGKILFLEDLDEYLYHVDRMMMALKRSGYLKELKGLLVGGMSEMKDNAVAFGKSAEEIIVDVVSEYSYPVIFNFPAGHLPENYPFVLGQATHIFADTKEMVFSQLTPYND